MTQTNKTARTWASTLDSVVVYAQGAVCRRLARGTVPPDTRLRVSGLPRSLDPDSLRARVLNAPGVRVTEARVEVEAEPLGAGVPDALRREVVRLREECAAAQGRLERQLALIEEVRGLRPVPPERRRGDPHRRTPVDAWLELAEFVDARLTRLHARLAELEEARRLVEHELSVAADRLARASTDAPAAHVETTVCAVLTLDRAADPEAPEPESEREPELELELELEYAVPGAVWTPAYRLTHRRGEGSGRLLLRASVAQRTGEDWTGVRIALATADLRRRTDLPKLRSLRIGRRQPAPAPSSWREPPAGLADLFAGYEAAGPRPAPAPVPTAGARAAVGAGSAPGSLPQPPPPPPVPAPVSAPPPAPQGYGAPPAALPVPGGVDGVALQGFGAAVPSPAPPAARSRAAGRPGGGGGFAVPAPAPMASAPMAPAAARPGLAGARRDRRVRGTAPAL
ncbi:DUF4139 domain-containing protein, partial [Streptomyces sp. NPDC000659]|uniref:DUF4139 domain-containing protein n=1 Tax=Streptomyces sp. NPDC000659 TaxID=3154367 RepID=UPI00332D5067